MERGWRCGGGCREGDRVGVNGLITAWWNDRINELRSEWVSRLQRLRPTHTVVRSALSPLFNYNNLPCSSAIRRWLECLMPWLKLFTMKLNLNHQHLLQRSAHLCAGSTISGPLIKGPGFLCLPLLPSLLLSLPNTLLTPLSGFLPRCSAIATPCSWRLLPRRMLEHTPARPSCLGLGWQREMSLWPWTVSGFFSEYLRLLVTFEPMWWQFGIGQYFIIYVPISTLWSSHSAIASSFPPGPPILTVDATQHAVKHSKGKLECRVGSSPPPEKIVSELSYLCRVSFHCAWDLTTCSSCSSWPHQHQSDGSVHLYPWPHLHTFAPSHHHFPHWKTLSHTHTHIHNCDCRDID